MSDDALNNISVGEIVNCTVEQLMPYGAFVKILPSGRKGMIHISELSYNFVKNISDVISVQDKVKAKIVKIDEKGRIDLSIKQAMERPVPAPRPQPKKILQNQNQNQNSSDEVDSFEKKMAAFMKTSEAKITDLNARNSARSGHGRRSNGNNNYSRDRNNNIDRDN